MLISEIIRKKRDGEILDGAEVSAMVNGITSGHATEGQIAAFAMAVFFNNMSPPETTALTMAMRDSGDVFSWHDLNGPVVDKHSTGGVGDNVSLMLAPIVAACGGFVPMISGRGLGHTGGTLDKMESIPGYQVQPDNDLFDKVVRETGCAIIGQTGDLAPADKRFYGIRDVTATVESIPLITASILSKKLAAGLQSLVMDVKFGNGAFMSTAKEARELAQSITRVARGTGLPCHALITDMNQPLASAAGNAVEVTNAVNFLTGDVSDPRLREVTLALAAEMLVTSGIHANRQSGLEAATNALENGSAAACFAKMVGQLGGPADFMENSSHYLPTAPVITPIFATESGHVAAMDTRHIGLAVVELGGGRRKAADAVDPAVGFTDLVHLGQEVTKGEPIAMVHARTPDQVALATTQLTNAIKIGAAPNLSPAVLEIID